MRPELQDIVDEVSRLLQRPATLEDRHFNLVAFCSHGEEIDEENEPNFNRADGGQAPAAGQQQAGGRGPGGSGANNNRRRRRRRTGGSGGGRGPGQGGGGQ